jgi:branched-subunit amino acid aminotransferase/4-amino-4-deoxychorismate lyase
MAGALTYIMMPTGITKAPYAANSLAEAALFEPDGVYTVARTFEGSKALLLDEHLNRLEQSAALEGIPLRLDRAALRGALRSLLIEAGYDNARFRITIPREQPAHIYLSVEPFRPVPPEIVAGGARIISTELERHNPTAKTTAWMAHRRAAVENLPPGIYEAVLVSPDGQMLECTSSNFYAVRSGQLYTADDSQVLAGIARRVVLTLAGEILPVTLRAPLYADLKQFDEALLSSAGRGVVAVVEIDGVAIGGAKPGQFTLAIRAAYEAWAAAHLEEI